MMIRRWITQLILVLLMNLINSTSSRIGRAVPKRHSTDTPNLFFFRVWFIVSNSSHSWNLATHFAGELNNRSSGNGRCFSKMKKMVCFYGREWSVVFIKYLVYVLSSYRCFWLGRGGERRVVSDVGFLVPKIGPTVVLFLPKLVDFLHPATFDNMNTGFLFIFKPHFFFLIV